MPRSFKRRSSSMDSLCEDSVDQINPKAYETYIASKAEDLETARQLLSSLLYIKDASGRSYLHTNFHLSWAKALLDRAKSLDEDSEQYMDGDMTCVDQFKNRRYRNASHQNKESTSFPAHARSTNADCTSSSGTLMQRRFLLQPDKESGYTPFHVAIMERNLAAILLFLRHATADATSTDRLTQRPMTLLHAAEANHGHNRNNNQKNNRSNNNLLLAMANATDHEGMTPLRLLGRLQQPELFRCRHYLRSFRPCVDRNATMRLRTRPRQSSYDINSNDNASGDETIDYFSENADLLQIHEVDEDDEEKRFSSDNVSYGCEVVTFGRPHHCALGVVQGGSSSSSAFVSSNKDNSNQTYSHGSSFCPQRVQEFAQETVGRQGSAMCVAAATHHSLVVTKKGHLYAFGLGKGGRLGLGDDQPQQCPLPKRVLGPLQRRKVVSVAAAENHSLCVTSQGDVYSWGSNRFGQLGDHATGSSPIATCGSRSIPRRVENLKQHPCVAVAAGEKHSVALSRKGEVYVWGDNTSGQLGVSRRTGIQKVQRVEALWGTSTSQGNSNSSSPKIAIAIAAAAQSTLVLTTGSPSSRLTNVNAIYEWGHGNHVPIRVHFESYNKAANSKNDNSHRFASSFSRTPNPTAIACARYHNVAITSDGMVYTWGLHAESLGRSNSNKSLKQQHHNQRRNSSPQLVSGMLPENGGGFAVAVDASASHTAVVCNNGALFTWGTTDGNNVLGHEGVRWQPNPKRVPGVHRAVDVAVSKEHTILLIGTSFPSIPKNERLPCLDVLAAHKVAEYVDLFNVIPVLMMAERTQSRFLIEYCTKFVHKNLDGVLNVAKKTIMNQYLNDMLADTTYRAGKRYRDDHHHPITFDVLSAGNVGRPTFDRNWFSGFEEWIQGCKELVESRVVRQLLEVAAVREYEEDSNGLNFKARRSSSCQKEYHEFKQRTRSTSDSSLIPEVKEGHLDRCIKRTANMNLSTIELANENASWLSKEIRGVRKKLKQISNLLDAETKNVTLSVEQKAKVARRPTLETELSIYESAVKEVTKRIEELTIENRVNQKQLSSLKVDDVCHKEIEAPSKSIGTKENESILVTDAKKDEDPSDSIPEQKDEKPFFCQICGVKCSDKSNFILHQNGRKHRNKVAQLAEEEKEKTAASIRQQQQMELMNSAPIFTPPSKKIVKNAWGTASTQPNYKLPPPPHPVLAQVSPLQRSRKGAMSPPLKAKPACSPSNSKSLQQDKGIGTKKKPQVRVNADSPSSPQDFSTAVSNFTTILREQERVRKSSSGGMKDTSSTLAWNSSPSSTRCVPLSLYSAPDLSSSSGRVQSYDERSSSISLADFLTPPKKKPPSKSGTSPWMQGPTTQSKTSPTPNAKSIAQIQAEEENLRSKQDKSYGKGGGSWYVERRERADSVLQIQKAAQEDLEHRLLVEEQLKIEAQIREENDRRQKREKEKEKSKKDKGAPKRRKKKAQNNKKPNPSNSTKMETKSPDAAKTNRSNGKNKPSGNSSKKMATKSPRQTQKSAKPPANQRTV